MTADHHDTGQRRRAGWPTEYWAVVVPGLFLLLPAGTLHLAGRLEGLLRRMSIEADMVFAPISGMLVFAALLMFIVFREHRERVFAFRLLVWSMLLTAALLIADFLAAVAIQLAWPAAPTDFSEGWRVVLQAVAFVPYVIRVYVEYRKLRADADAKAEGSAG